ncbi:hypothetical protein Tco_0723229 [Tanacetum coccineum]
MLLERNDLQTHIIPLTFKEYTQTPFHPDQSSHIIRIQHPQPNNLVPQPSFNANSKQQPMQNSKDTSDPTIAMNMALHRLAKALMLNNQRSGKNIVQNVGKMNGISVDTRIANQHGIRNVVTARAEGNSNGSNDNQITCVNSYEEGHHHASTCTIKLKKLDVAYLQKHIQIAQKEEAGIQLTQEEFDFMDDACASEETERVQMNCTSEDTLQQASTSGTQPDNAPVYDSYGSTEVPNDETCCDNDIFNILPSDVQSTDLQTELDRTKEKLETCIIKKEKEYVVL